MMNHFYTLILIFSMVMYGCGSNTTETGDNAIKRTTEVLDTRLYEGAPKKSYKNEDSSRVGFDESGKESRMLLFFPKLKELWDEKIVVSSIANVELLIYCDEIAVNPENIELLVVKNGWNPFATWTLRDNVLGESWLTPGGDFHTTIDPVKPALRKSVLNPNAFELSFNISLVVQRMILDGLENLGFLIRVKKSDLNSSQQISFRTSSWFDSTVRPSSVLIFSTKDAVE